MRGVLSSLLLCSQVEVMEVQKYLVKWSGLSYQFCTWEDREEVKWIIDCPLIALFCSTLRQKLEYAAS